ncbi:MAG: FAM151A/B family protein [Anaerolineales bacterium]
MATSWMQSLSTCYEKTQGEFPGERLLLLTDVDGTIIDMRHMIIQVLWAYDREHGTKYFDHLQLEDIDVHENEVDSLLEERKVPKRARKKILAWYLENRWSRQAIGEMHRPFEGVLEMIRWFQLQPNTHVGLVTGRPEALREDTLRSLNELGKLYRVQFKDELLYMNPDGWEHGVQQVKINGLRHFQEMGYHVFAFIDNEPANLKALSKAEPDSGMLMLHANTIFQSKRTRVPAGTVRGKDYRLTELIPGESALPSHVQLAWHGVNDEANLRQFLASDVRWAEVDVILDPAGSELVLRHDSFENTPVAPGERWVTLESVLKKIRKHQRGVKLDMKLGNRVLDLTLSMVRKHRFVDQDIWFNANVERLKEEGFRRIAGEYPGSILQAPIDFLRPLILATPKKAHETLEMFANWGINRFSISWERPDLLQLFDQMDQWGYEVNIYNVPDLEAFLQAVLLLPRSVTSDFNFPQWQYFGRGSGQDLDYVTYQIRRAKKRLNRVRTDD